MDRNTRKTIFPAGIKIHAVVGTARNGDRRIPPSGAARLGARTRRRSIVYFQLFGASAANSARTSRQASLMPSEFRRLNSFFSAAFLSVVRVFRRKSAPFMPAGSTPLGRASREQQPTESEGTRKMKREGARERDKRERGMVRSCTKTGRTGVLLAKRKRSHDAAINTLRHLQLTFTGVDYTD